MQKNKENSTFPKIQCRKYIISLWKQITFDSFSGFSNGSMCISFRGSPQSLRPILFSFQKEIRHAPQESKWPLTKQICGQPYYFKHDSAGLPPAWICSACIRHELDFFNLQIGRRQANYQYDSHKIFYDFIKFFMVL